MTWRTVWAVVGGCYAALEIISATYGLTGDATVAFVAASMSAGMYYANRMGWVG